MKKDRLNRITGISLIALVITVFIMVVLLATAVISYDNIITSIEEKEFANEIYSIQKLVDNYKFMHNTLPIEGEKMNVTSINSAFPGESGDYYKIDLAEADVNEVTRGTGNLNDDYYIVNNNTGKVYYLAGVQIGKTRYYTLTDDLKQKVGLNK